MQKIIGVLFVLLFVSVASWAGVVYGSMTAKNDWMLIVVWAVIVVGVLAVSLLHQRSGKSDWWLLWFYTAFIGVMVGIFIDNNTIASIIIIIIASASAAIIGSILLFVSDGFASAGPAVVAAIFITVVIAYMTFVVNQQSEYAVFMACVIIASYAIAKLAKRFGWIKVAEKPATPA